MTLLRGIAVALQMALPLPWAQHHPLCGSGLHPGSNLGPKLWGQRWDGDRDVELVVVKLELRFWSWLPEVELEAVLSAAGCAGLQVLVVLELLCCAAPCRSHLPLAPLPALRPLFFIYPLPSFSLVKVEEEATDKDNQNCSTDTVCSKVTALQHLQELRSAEQRLLLRPARLLSHTALLRALPWLQAVLLRAAVAAASGCERLRWAARGCAHWGGTPPEPFDGGTAAEGAPGPTHRFLCPTDAEQAITAGQPPALWGRGCVCTEHPLAGPKALGPILLMHITALWGNSQLPALADASPPSLTRVGQGAILQMVK